MKVRFFSPLGFLALAACNGESTSPTPTTVTGFAIKGPLQNALVFADANGNEVHDTGEASVRTGSDGAYSLENPNNYTIVVATDDTTTDLSTGQVLSGLTLVGTANGGVITPITMIGAGMDNAALASALGLDPSIDIATFNPYAEGVDPALALAYEKISQSLVGTAQVLQGATGVSLQAAFTAAADAALNGGSLSDAIAGLNGDLTELEIAGIVDQIDTIEAAIDAVTSLEPADTDNAFSAAGALGKIYETGGVGTGNTANVGDIVTNEAPTDIVFNGGEDVSVTENADSADPISIAVTDTDSDTHVFELSGDDADLFEIVEGQLQFVEGVEHDFETQASYSVTVKATDDYGKSVTRSLTIDVEGVNEDTTFVDDYESVYTGQVAVGDHVSALDNSALFAVLEDVDNVVNGHDADDFTGASVQWLADGEAISGATSLTYDPTEAQIGQVLSVQYTVTDQQGYDNVITEEVGEILSHHPGDPDGAPLVVNFKAGFDTVLNEMMGTMVNLAEAPVDSDAMDQAMEHFQNDFLFGDESDVSIALSEVNGLDRVTVSLNDQDFIRVDFEDLSVAEAAALIQPNADIDFTDPDTWLTGSFRELSFTGYYGTFFKLEFDPAADSNDEDTLRLVFPKSEEGGLKTIGIKGDFSDLADLGAIFQAAQDIGLITGEIDPELSPVDALIYQLGADVGMTGFFLETQGAGGPDLQVSLKESGQEDAPDRIYLGIGEHSITIDGTLPEGADRAITLQKIIDNYESLMLVVDGEFEDDLADELGDFIKEIRINDGPNDDTVLSYRFNDWDTLAENLEELDVDEIDPHTITETVIGGEAVTVWADNDGLYEFVGDAAAFETFLDYPLPEFQI